MSIARLWTGSLRRRLVLGVAGLHAVLMTGFVLDVALGQDRFLRETSLRQSQGLAEALGAASASWVLANDIEGLGEVLDALRAYPGLRHAMVLDADLRVIAHSDPTQRGAAFAASSLRGEPATHGASADASGNAEAMVPVLAARRLVGWAVVALDPGRIAAARQSVAWRGAWAVALAVLVGSALALALGRGLTTDLDRLARAADEVRRGQPVRSGVDRADELGRMARGFDAMLDALERQQRAERALREDLAMSEQRLDRAMTAANEALWSYSPRQRAVTFWARGRSGLGLEGEHTRAGAILSDELWRSLIHPEDMPRVLAALPPGQECGGDIVMDVRVRHTDAAWRTFQLHGQASCGSEGRLEHIEGAVIDVTAQRDQERQHEQLKSALERSQRLEALGRLAGGVAHDFNNMLAAVLAHAELLMADVAAAQRPDVLAIIEAAQRARAVASQVMAFSRGHTTAPHAVDVRRAAAEVSRLLAPSLGRQRLEWQSVASGSWVRADRSGLVQVLMNLCGNARDAQPADGLTEVSFARSHLKGRCASCGQAYAGEFACISVSDHGHGISDNALPRLFEPFYTTREGAGGHGLGLSVVHGLVHGWGGHIALNTGPGGTTFLVLLAPAPPASIMDAPTSLPPRPPAGRVLVVDDEPLVGRALERLLRRRGWAVTLTSGVDAACEALSRERVELVVSDYSMADGTGLDLVRRMAAAGHCAPVILMTGDASSVPRDAGVLAVLEKPVDVERLDELLRERTAAGER
jgi:signal transduction histidine kinase/CheY-like chemotaxis protein/HAMP domain-containing protein